MRTGGLRWVRSAATLAHVYDLPLSVRVWTYHCLGVLASRQSTDAHGYLDPIDGAATRPAKSQSPNAPCRPYCCCAHPLRPPRSSHLGQVGIRAHQARLHNHPNGRCSLGAARASCSRAARLVPRKRRNRAASKYPSARGGRAGTFCKSRRRQSHTTTMSQNDIKKYVFAMRE